MPASRSFAATAIALFVGFTAHEAPAQTQVSISMAAAAATPKINGPSVFGVYAGTPIVHTIAATGQAPLSYSATGLPTGVTLDAASGRLSGSVAAAGDHTIVVRVTNASGSAERALTLRVGTTLALTPPIGWNSYDSFDDNIREAQFLEQARWVRDNLLPYGWDTVVVDFRWYDPDTPGSSQTGNNPQLRIDSNGRLLPATNKFPSATGTVGFKSIADQVHAMGLKFGIHIMRGIPRLAVNADSPIANSTHSALDAVRPAGNNGRECVWNTDMYGVLGDTPAGQAWYDSILSQYAGWGIDFIKVDDMTKNRPANQIEYHRSEVEAIVNSIKKSGRSIVLSLSPGETPVSSADHVKVWANMWRMSDDFWDRSADLDNIFALSNSWQVVMDAPGHWPDADMLPLGRLTPYCPIDGLDRSTRFTRNEQVTMLSLWSLLPSPLMLGTNLVQTTDTFTRALIMNEEVLAVNQDSLGKRARRITLGTNREGWIKPLSGDRYAVGLFNRGTSDQAVSVTWAQLAITGRFNARLLWQRQDLGVRDATLEQMVPNRAAALILLTPETPVNPSGGAGGVGGGPGAGAGGAPPVSGSAGTGGVGGATGGLPSSTGGTNASSGAGSPSASGGPSAAGAPIAGQPVAGGGTPTAPSAGTGNTSGGVAGQIATAGNAASGARNVGGAPGGAGSGSDDSGCSCSVPAQGSPAKSSLAWAALTAAFVVWRRRRRSSAY